MKKSISTILIVFILFGCENEEKSLKVTKAKYDNAINQVVTLENKKLQEEGELSVDEVLLRENLGVTVYSDGYFIRLYYNIDGSDKWPRTEKTYKHVSKKYYEQVNDEDIMNEETQKYFETNSYTERVPIK